MSAELDDAIRERDARPEITRDGAEELSSWISTERAATEHEYPVPGWLVRVHEALRAHAAGSGKGGS